MNTIHTYKVSEIQIFDDSEKKQITSWRWQKIYSDRRIFSKDSLLVPKYLQLDFVRGHSGQIRYNLFAIFLGVFLCFPSLNTLWILVIYDNLLHPRWLSVLSWGVFRLKFLKSKLYLMNVRFYRVVLKILYFHNLALPNLVCKKVNNFYKNWL